MKKKWFQERSYPTSSKGDFFMLILLIGNHESYGFFRSIWNQFELVSFKKKN